jgi:ribosomal protein L13
VIVQEAGGEGRVEIVDATARVVGRLAAAAMGASVALAMARWAIGYLRQRTD